MSKILKVTPNNNYNLLVEFEHGSKIIFNMRDIVKTIPFSILEDLSCFKDITVEKKVLMERNGLKTTVPEASGLI